MESGFHKLFGQLYQGSFQYKVSQVRKKLFKGLEVDPDKAWSNSNSVMIKFDTPVMRGADASKRGVNSSSSRKNSGAFPIATSSSSSRKNSASFPLHYSSKGQSSSPDISTPRFTQHSISEKKLRNSRPEQEASNEPRPPLLANPSPNFISTKEKRKRALVFLRKYAKFLKNEEKKQPTVHRKSTFASQQNVLEEPQKFFMPRVESNSPAKKEKHRSSFYQKYANPPTQTDLLTASYSTLPTLKLQLSDSKTRSRNNRECKRHSLASYPTSTFLKSIEKLAMGPLHK